MDSNKIIKIIIFIISSVLLIIFDQLTKKIAIMRLMNNSAIPVIKNIIEFTYAENRGAAFGMLQGKQVLFYILTIIVFIGIFIIVFKLPVNKKYNLLFAVLILIFSGACGNFIDRITNKYVVDFIYFKPIDFPVFNVADMYITIGCIILFLSLVTVYKNDDFKFICSKE